MGGGGGGEARRAEHASRASPHTTQAPVGKRNECDPDWARCAAGGLPRGRGGDEDGPPAGHPHGSACAEKALAGGYAARSVVVNTCHDVAEDLLSHPEKHTGFHVNISDTRDWKLIRIQDLY